MRKMLTPGRLYTTLSAEFRRVRCADCANCVLPAPNAVVFRDEEEPSWVLPDLPGACEACRKAIVEIVRRAQAKYDMLDPFSPLFGMRRAPGLHASH